MGRVVGGDRPHALVRRHGQGRGAARCAHGHLDRAPGATRVRLRALVRRTRRDETGRDDTGRDGTARAVEQADHLLVVPVGRQARGAQAASVRAAAATASTLPARC